MGLHLDDEDIIYFLHIPKTAGTSLQYYLQQFFSVDEVCPAQVQGELEEIPRDELQRYRLFAGHFWGLPRFLPREPRLITMVREPIQRALSNYRHIQRDGNHHLHRLAKEQRIGELAQYPAIRNSQTRHLAAHHPEYVPRMADEACESLAREVLDTAEFVGVVEYSELSMSLLACTFHWPPLMESPSLNPAWKPRGGAGAESSWSRDRAVLESANQIDSRIYELAMQRFFGSVEATLRRAARERYTQGLVRTDDVSQWTCDLGGAVSGSGWHAAEIDGRTGTGFRWSGPGRTATVDIPIDSAKVGVICVEILSATPRRQRAGLRIFVNGVEVKVSRRRRSKVGHLIRVEIPREIRECAGFPLRVTLNVPETFSPARKRGQDSRALGVAVSSVAGFVLDPKA